MSTKVISFRLSHEQTENLSRVNEKYPGLKIDLRYVIDPALDAYLERLLSSETDSAALVVKEKNIPASLLRDSIDENSRPEGYTSLFNNEPNVEVASSLFEHAPAPELTLQETSSDSGLISASSFFDGTSRKIDEDDEIPTKLKDMLNRIPVSVSSDKK